MKYKVLINLIATLLFVTTGHAQTPAPLPSWNDSASKTAIIDFVKKVTDESSKDFVPVNERIATFDNDGTLWAEKPLYFQIYFAFDEIKANAKNHPEWKKEEPFASVIKGDYKKALKNGVSDIKKIIAATHGDMSVDDFAKKVSNWLKTAKHPTKQVPYTQMVYQPMLELLDYLQKNDFKTYIVSAGGVDFMRVWSEQVYNIPMNQVIGSRMQVSVVEKDGKPVLIRKPDIDLLDDKEAKIHSIYQHIGRRPIAAFGNSDGDLNMLEYTAAGSGPRLAVFVHHTDEKREWAYDSDSHVGQLKEGLKKAKENNWILIDMKNDWKTIFPAENRYK